MLTEVHTGIGRKLSWPQASYPSGGQCSDHRWAMAQGKELNDER